MHNVTERLYIFSVYNSKRNEKENKYVHDTHIQLLKDKRYRVTEVQGRYKGVNELSILLYGTNLTEPMIFEIAKAQMQESYLVVYHDGVAELVFSDGNRKILGELKETTEEIAKSSEDYSKIGNQFFIIQ